MAPTGWLGRGAGRLPGEASSHVIIEWEDHAPADLLPPPGWHRWRAGSTRSRTARPPAALHSGAASLASGLLDVSAAAASSSSSNGCSSELAAALAALQHQQPQQPAAAAAASLVADLAEGLETPVQLIYLLTLLGFLTVGAFLVARQVLIRRELEEAAKVLGDRIRTGVASSEVSGLGRGVEAGGECEALRAGLTGWRCCRCVAPPAVR